MGPRMPDDPPSAVYSLAIADGGGGGGGGGLAQSVVRQGAPWLTVALSVALADVQAASYCHGGVQVATRQTTGP